MSKTIKIIKNRSDIGAGTRGADMGVDAIEIAAINEQSDYFTQYEFEDLETSEKVIVDTGSLRHIYRKRVMEFIDKLKHICHENETRYVLSPTNQTIEKSLIQIANK